MTIKQKKKKNKKKDTTYTGYRTHGHLGERQTQYPLHYTNTHAFPQQKTKV